MVSEEKEATAGTQNWTLGYPICIMQRQRLIGEKVLARLNVVENGDLMTTLAIDDFGCSQLTVGSRPPRC